MAPLIHAVIGSVGHADETVFPLIEQLMEEGHPVTVIDNRGTFPDDLLDQWHDEVAYHQAPGFNIHQVWNLGMDIAESQGADWCCILNDDVTLDKGAPRVVANVCKDADIWIAGFDYEGHEDFKLRRAVGSYREHGVGGFAYMIRPDVGLRYDERFTWWGGDDDLVWTCLKMGGRAVVVEGANVSHPPGGNTTGRHYPELAEGIKGDYDLIRSKWGKSW